MARPDRLEEQGGALSLAARARWPHPGCDPPTGLSHRGGGRWEQVARGNCRRRGGATPPGPRVPARCAPRKTRSALHAVGHRRNLSVSGLCGLHIPSLMTAYVLDWLSLLGRWLHLVAGIAWIGSSFYFIWLDNHLLPPADPVLAKSGVAGELWAVLAVLLSTAAWGLCRLFCGRGAYMEFGAMLGTIMVANVFFVIIPAQRGLVRAKEEDREPDLRGAIAAKLRSTHNTYFTLPVLFVMISPHYPITYGARENWLVLIVICAAGVLLRVYFVARHNAHERQGHTSPLPAALGVLALAGVAFALMPRSSGNGAGGLASAGSFVRIEAIVERRCAGCHSAQPTLAGFTAAPNGVLLDTPERILARTDQIRQQLATRAMPVGNVTGITEEERAEMLAWIERGAPH